LAQIQEGTYSLTEIEGNDELEEGGQWKQDFRGKPACSLRPQRVLSDPKYREGRGGSDLGIRGKGGDAGEPGGDDPHRPLSSRLSRELGVVAAARRHLGLSLL